MPTKLTEGLSTNQKACQDQPKLANPSKKGTHCGATNKYISLLSSNLRITYMVKTFGFQVVDYLCTFIVKTVKLSRRLSGKHSILCGTPSLYSTEQNLGKTPSLSRLVTSNFITGRKRSWGKVMFTQVCVCSGGRYLW